MTVKIFGDRSPDPLHGVKKAQKTQSPNNNSRETTSDRVDFSSVLKEVNQAKEITPLASMERTKKVQDFSSVLKEVNQAKEMSPLASIERTKKVQALKEQVANGNYHPDLHKVAASLLRFLTEGR